MGKRGPRLARARQMTEVEAAWVGAMIEGEGSVIVRQSRSGYHELKIVVHNTDVEIMSAMLRAVGTGSIGVKTFSKQWQRKTCWVWQLQAAEDVRAVAAQCKPYSTKCQKVQV